VRIFLTKAIKFFIAMLVIPIFKPLLFSIWDHTIHLSERTIYDVNPLSLCLGGIILWVIFALFFRLPSRIYVFAHELTHAIFIKICGGKIKKLSVQKNQGYVISDRSNFLITLAPYLFPFYAVIFGIIIVIIKSTLNPPYVDTILWIVLGVCLGYHWMMTGKMLMTRQSDFSSQGYFFSFTLILLTNFSLFLLLLFLLPTPVYFGKKALVFANEVRQSYVWIFAKLEKLIYSMQ
jgi:hypothetical protein